MNASARVNSETPQMPPERQTATTDEASRLKRLEGLLSLYASLWASNDAARAMPEYPADIAADVFRNQFYSLNRPVVIRQAASRWTAVKTWSPEFFARRFGKSGIQFEIGPDYRSARGVSSVSDFVKSIREHDAPEAGYVVANSRAFASSVLRPLLDEIGDFGFIPRFNEFKHAAQLWLGPRGTVTQLHHDVANNVFTQIYGEKEFRLAPSFSYPRLCGSASIYSDYDPDSDALSDILWTKLRLAPGDVLFIPAGWWHWVRAVSVSISVNVNFSLGETSDQWDDASA